MWSQYSELGFYKTPVTKCVLSTIGFLSILLIIVETQYKQYFTYTTESIVEHFEVWRLVTSKIAFMEIRSLFLGLLLLYNFRLFEKRYGSTKYASYLLANGVITTVLEVLALFIMQHYRQSSIPLHWAPGLTGVIFSLFVPLILDVPYLSSLSTLGHILSGKWFIYILGLQTLAQSAQTVAIVACGLISGLLYRANFLCLRSWLRIPSVVADLANTSLGPMLTSTAPAEGAIPTGATLELQRQQRIEMMEQRMMLDQEQQFRRQARRGQQAATSRVRPTISAPIRGSSTANLASLFRQRHQNRTGDTPDTLPGSTPSQSPTNPNPNPSPVSEDSIQQLTDMGFNRSAVVRALMATHNNISMATNLLLQDG